MGKHIKLDRGELTAIEAIFHDIEFNTWQRSGETVLTQLYSDSWRLGKCYGLYQVEIVQHTVEKGFVSLKEVGVLE